MRAKVGTIAEGLSFEAIKISGTRQRPGGRAVKSLVRNVVFLGLASMTACSCNDQVIVRDREALCGNGIINRGEVCDDGNIVNTDSCTSGCQEAVCGDGVTRQDVAVTDPGYEECDDGNGDNTDICPGNCRVAHCGDGFVGRDEQCDDGNNVAGDGCHECVESRCGDGVIQAGEACDDGNDIDTDTCLMDCRVAACGDGVQRLDLEAGEPGYEACDDGNASNLDACLISCALAACGDGLTREDLAEVDDGFEGCDDGNQIDEDACLTNCQPAICGDGIHRRDLGAGEQGFEACDGPSCDDDCQRRVSSRRLSVSLDAVCYVKSGQVWCWGMNFRGIVTGDGIDRIPHSPEVFAPQRIPGIETAKSVSVAFYHACAVLNDGTAKCWGNNKFGQLGRQPMDTNDSAGANAGHAPGVVAGAHEWQAVITGASHHSCGLDTDGLVWCWGQGNAGQLGIAEGAIARVANPVQVILPMLANFISVGTNVSCAALQDGYMTCWGHTPGARNLAYEPALDDSIEVVGYSAASGAGCRISRDGRVSCRGSENRWGSLGSGDFQQHLDDWSNVVGLPDDLRPYRVATSKGHSCVISDDSTLWCWGWNTYGEVTGTTPSGVANCGWDPQLGHGTALCEPSAHLVDQFQGIGVSEVALEFGSSQYGGTTCVLLQNDDVYCWGRNYFGTVGLGFAGQPRNQPTLVRIPEE